LVAVNNVLLSASFQIIVVEAGVNGSQGDFEEGWGGLYPLRTAVEVWK